MKHIELHLECYKGEGGGELAKLGLLSEENTEWRPVIVFLDAIMLIYPAEQGGTIIIIAGEDYLFQESYIDIVESIKRTDVSKSVTEGDILEAIEKFAEDSIPSFRYDDLTKAIYDQINQ